LKDLLHPVDCHGSCRNCTAARHI